MNSKVIGFDEIKEDINHNSKFYEAQIVMIKPRESVEEKFESTFPSESYKEIIKDSGSSLINIKALSNSEKEVLSDAEKKKSQGEDSDESGGNSPQKNDQRQNIDHDTALSLAAVRRKSRLDTYGNQIIKGKKKHSISISPTPAVILVESYKKYNEDVSEKNINHDNEKKGKCCSIA